MRIIILSLALLLLTLNGLYARLEILNDGKINIISPPAFECPPFKVSADEKWRLSETLIRADAAGNKQFVIRIQASIPFCPSLQQQTYCQAVISMDDGTIDYAQRLTNGPGDHFIIPLNNPPYLNQLRHLLRDCVVWTNWYQFVGAENPGTFTCPDGDYHFVFSARPQGAPIPNAGASQPSAMERLRLQIKLTRQTLSGSSNQIISEPGALLTILDSLDDLKSSFQAELGD